LLIMKKDFIGLLLAIICSLCAKSQKDSSDQLPVKIGDKAPPLSIIKWVKGKPIDHFERGKVYIVEFGFLSCSPCRASIPHLTALAKKYPGKLTIISVDIWENHKDNPTDLSYVSRAEAFVKKMGSRIAYTFAVDNPQQTTAETWGGGAPLSFVIDQHGRIAWIGHPTELHMVIDQVLEGQFNASEAALKQQHYHAELDSAVSHLFQLKMQGKLPLAVHQVDSLISANPDKAWLYAKKFFLLKDSDDRAADIFLLWMLDHYKVDFDAFLIYIAGEMIYRKNFNPSLCLQLIDRVISRCNYDLGKAIELAHKATIYRKMGDLNQAIKIQKGAIKLFEPYVTKNQFHDELKGLKNQLAYFENLKTQSGK
ncbi:MAG: TlpA family protein disulfide reductase, partial [Flavisolibacter sp.]